MRNRIAPLQAAADCRVEDAHEVLSNALLLQFLALAS